MNKNRIYQIWLILAAYGVWFAVLSGLEEVGSGKYWKVGASMLLGIGAYFIVEKKLKQ